MADITDSAWLVEAWHRGQSLRQLGELCGVSTTTVQRRLREHGVDTGAKRKRPPGSGRLTADQITALVQLARAQPSLTWQKLGDRFSLSAVTVGRILRKAGFKRRRVHDVNVAAFTPVRSGYLSEQQQREIVNRYSDGESGTKLAAAYDVRPATIYRLVHGSRTSKHGPTHRRCGLCGIEKKLNAFPRATLRPDTAYHAYVCKVCVREQQHARGYALIRNAGITLAQYEDLLQRQDGHCALCERQPGQRRLHVDHDHVTGMIRGLLCPKCNTWMAAVDDQDWLRRAMIYRQRETEFTWRPRHLRKRKPAERDVSDKAS